MNEEPLRADEAGPADAGEDAEMQTRLEGMEIEGEAGAGLVTVTLNGKGDLRRIKIDPKVIDPADAEMLEDLIVAAHANARQKLEDRRRGRNAEGHRRPATAAGDEAALLCDCSPSPRGRGLGEGPWSTPQPPSRQPDPPWVGLKSSV